MRNRRRPTRPINFRSDEVGASARSGCILNANAKELDRCAVVVRRDAVGVAGEERVRQFSDGGSKQSPALQQGGCHLLARGDVAHELDRTHGFLAMTNERGGDADPQRTAILVHAALLYVQLVYFSSPQALEPRSGGLEVIYQRETRDGRAVEFCRTEPEQQTECLVAVTVTTIAVCEGYADRCLHEGIARQRFKRWKSVAGLARIGEGENILCGDCGADGLHRSARGL